MRNTKTIKSNTIFSAIEFIIGIILLFRPEGFTSVIIVALGCCFIVLGALNTINYFRTERVEAMKTNLLSKGLLLLIIGLFFTFNSKWFIVTFPITTVLYGVFMMLIGVVKFQSSIDGLRLKEKYWYINLIGALLTLFASVMIISNPFTSAEFIWKFIAVSMLIEAAIDILGYLLNIKDERAEKSTDNISIISE
ncbi:MAG: DUF308 domain-containing protein [Acutalibacteraceae bacterium]|nr:DUF308 domain-containing protein [Acutalibacteraceae bacterium]